MSFNFNGIVNAMTITNTSLIVSQFLSVYLHKYSTKNCKREIKFPPSLNKGYYC